MYTMKNCVKEPTNKSTRLKKKKSERCAKSYDCLRLFCITLYS